MRVCFYIYVCVSVSVSMFVAMAVCVCVSVCLWLWLSVCVCVCVHGWRDGWICERERVRERKRESLYIHVYIADGQSDGGEHGLTAAWQHGTGAGQTKAAPRQLPFM